MHNLFMAEKEIYIKVTKNGPYLVFGSPELKEKTILIDEEGYCIGYGEGKTFEIKTDPYALCRCGASKNPPFCDFSHSREGFQSTECASFEPFLYSAVRYEGKNLTLIDNEKLCAYARFCDAKGSIWNLIYEGTKEADEQAIKEANLCPAGRLVILDKDGNVLEHPLEKEISVLEDKGLNISGPLFLQGAIRVEGEDGHSYEIRNRQTLCRCGKSKNQPFCDSTHYHIEFIAQRMD